MTVGDVRQHLAETNSKLYNYHKAIEEFTELNEVLIKKITKEGGDKEPSNESIIEEIGDCFIRLQILSAMFGDAAVENRVAYKMLKYASYIEQGKYKGQI
jgi:NTP pyrophosphatase (non-canonical NTP hydrolase)